MVSTMATDRLGESRVSETRSEAAYERWVHWPVNWSAVFAGALAAITAVLIFGLIGVALGAHVVDANQRLVDLKKMGISALVFSVFGAFLAFAIGGWVAGKIAGILHAEPGMLHGAISWLVATPIIVVIAGLGAGSLMGGWYGGLAGSHPSANGAATPFEKPDALSATATPEERSQYTTDMNDYRAKVRQWNEDTPKVTRNAAIGAATALLLGLIGSVIGGWLASGEPMNFTHHRTRRPLTHRV